MQAQNEWQAWLLTWPNQGIGTKHVGSPGQQIGDGNDQTKKAGRKPILLTILQRSFFSIFLHRFLV